MKTTPGASESSRRISTLLDPDDPVATADLATGRSKLGEATRAGTLAGRARLTSGTGGPMKRAR